MRSNNSAGKGYSIGGKNVTISNCVSRNDNSTGIYVLGDADNIVVSDCVVSSSGSYGMWITSDSVADGKAVISNNGGSVAGMRVELYNCIIAGNKVTNADDQDILATGDNYIISDNMIINSAGEGISIQYSDNGTISNNFITGCTDGINLWNVWNYIVSLNRVKDCSDDGIDEVADSDYNFIFANNVRGNTGSAIEHDGANSIIKDNIGYDNSTYINTFQQKVVVFILLHLMVHFTSILEIRH